jgi:glutathione-regulated potassium-efflux system ancillary protein KefC
MMLVEGISCTILDHDAEMVEAACSFGFRVFYGDASSDSTCCVRPGRNS